VEYPVSAINTIDPGGSNIWRFTLCYLSSFPHSIQNLASISNFLPQYGEEIFLDRLIPSTS